jgi:hypothetical protein
VQKAAGRKERKVTKESSKREREVGRTYEEGTNPFRKSSRDKRGYGGNKRGGIRKELAAAREEKGELRIELAAMREEMRGREEKWQAEKAGWMKRMTMIEEKMEQREKEETKNNVIVIGIGGIRGNIERRREE